MKIKIILVTLLLSINVSAISIGKVPQHTVIQGKDGGLVKGGKAWNSHMLKGNVFVMFYVDPDEKDVNEHYTQALKKFKKENNLHFQSIAIVNLAATWKPNFIIEKILASKQKEFPDTIYVKDKNAVLVKAWEVKDDASDIIIFDKNGKVIFYKAGAMNQNDIQKSFQLIKENLANG